MGQVEHRRDERYLVAMEVTLTSRHRVYQGRTVNLSLGGFRVVLADFELPRTHLELRTELKFPNGGRAETQAKVVWAAGREIGLAFSGPASPRVIAFAQLAARHHA